MTPGLFGETTAARRKPARKPAAAPALPVPAAAEQVRWACEWKGCLHKGRWWRSVHGVVNCRNCRPPSFPDLVEAEGGEDDTPMITKPAQPKWVDDPENYR